LQLTRLARRGFGLECDQRARVAKLADTRDLNLFLGINREHGMAMYRTAGFRMGQETCGPLASFKFAFACTNLH